MLLAGSAIALLQTLAGCASSGGSDEVNNGLSQIDAEGVDAEPIVPPGASQREIASRLEGVLQNYDELFEMTGSGEPADPEPESTNGEIPADPADTAAIAEVPSETDTETDAETEPTPEERARALASELEAVLRESADDPYVLAIRLAGLLAGEEDGPARLAGVIDRLPEDQRAVARAVAEIINAAGVSADGDPRRLTDALVAQAARLDEARPVRIGTLRLCSRVIGYGQYDELPSSSFVAGSPMRMIIYSEVEHFDSRRVNAATGARSSGSAYTPPAGIGTDEWEVRLSVELQLFHESDGLLAWRRPEEVTAYRSKSKVRDFFVVDQIELPRRLTVGAYRLKVILRDLGDRSVDERLVPIRVVADPALTGSDTTTSGG